MGVPVFLRGNLDELGSVWISAAQAIYLPMAFPGCIALGLKWQNMSQINDGSGKSRL
jgi:hypothetical protein